MRDSTPEDILMVFVEEMESRGINRKSVCFDIDAPMVEKINLHKKHKINLEQLCKYVDICLANEWLVPTVVGGKYRRLSITSTGVGVVRSRQRKAEALANRSHLKKFSDFIEDHKGLFVFLGAIIAIAGLFIKLYMS